MEWGWGGGGIIKKRDRRGAIKRIHEENYAATAIPLMHAPPPTVQDAPRVKGRASNNEPVASAVQPPIRPLI